MATNDSSDVILNIEVQYEDAIKGIAEYRKQVDALKKSNEDLKKQLKNGSISQEEYNKAISVSKIEMDYAKKAIQAYEKEIKNNIQTQTELEGSVNSLRAQLSNLNKQYDSLSETQRKAADGTQLRDSIMDITSKLKEAEEESGRFQRNVGNYEDSMKGAIASSGGFGKSLIFIQTAAKSSGGLIGGLIGQVKALTTAMIANPIIAIITAVVAIMAALKKGINSSAESTARFQKLLAPINAAMKILTNLLQVVVGWVLKGAEAFMSFAMGISKALEKLPVIGKYFKQINDETQ